MLVAVLTFLGAVALGAASAMTAAITLAATALIVPGTGTHNITTVMGYLENARDRFIAPANPSCTSSNGCVLVGIPYPASFFPIPLPGWCPGLSCDTWNVSVGTGVANLNSELFNQLNNPTPGNQQIVLFGYSQGGAVVSTEVNNLAGLDQATKDRITVVTIGNIDNPQGLWTRLSFLPTIPILNITFGPTLPTNIGIKSTNYDFEYDPVGDAPLYLLDPLSLLNALAAFQYVHGNYLVPNSNDPTGSLPYGYTDATLAAAISNPANIRTYQDATFVLIPWQGTLPIYQPFIDIASATGTTPLVKPIVDLLTPATKVLIDLGYNRTANPGIPQTFQLFPIVNPATLAVNLVAAVGQGIQNAQSDIGGTTPAPVSPPTTTGPSTVSTLAAPNSDPPADNSVVNPNPNPVTNVGTQSLMANNSQMTPANGQLTNPFTIPGLPKPNGSSSTPPAGSNGPGAGIQGVTTAVSDVINGLTKPLTPKPGAGTSNPQSTGGLGAAAA
jgi:PE-PPE domain